MADGTQLRQAMNVIWQERYGTTFDAWVREQRAADVSWRAIEREIGERVDLPISHVSLIKWFRETETAA